LLLLLSGTLTRVFGAGQPFYDVKTFGAVADGQTPATAAIQKAVDTCAAEGGGKVVIPSGRYLTGPIFLKSYVQVELEAGSVLVGSTNFADYPVIEGRWEGIERKMFSSLFTGKGLTHVSITGPGTVDGQGSVWWAAHRATAELRRQRGLVGREPENPSDAPLPWPRPRMFYLESCTNVLLRDLTILNSPSWNVHPVYCQHVTLDNLTIISPTNSPNTDAVDPDSCRDVRILNCYCDVGDDDIVLKSGYNADGRRVGIPCEDILISDCTFAHGHGGVAIGSEMSGSVRNVTVANCVFDGTQRGLRVKTAMGRGGVIENFRACNLVMRNIVDAAFSITSNYDGPRGSGTNAPAPELIPVMRHIHWSDAIVSGARLAAELNGLAESPVLDVSLRNIRFTSVKGGIHCEYAKGVRLENLDFQPASGPAVEAQKAGDLEVLYLTVQQPNPQAPVVLFKEVSGALVRDCQVSSGNGLFLKADGSNRDVVCENNRLALGIQQRSH
jgi:hypothetical protein